MQFMCCQTEHISQQIQGVPLSRSELQTHRIISSGSDVKEGFGWGKLGSSDAILVVVLRRLEERWEDGVSGSGEISRICELLLVRFWLYLGVWPGHWWPEADSRALESSRNIRLSHLFVEHLVCLHRLTEDFIETLECFLFCEELLVRG